MNEAQTRYDLIDPALREAGWGTVPESEVKTEWPITAPTKPGAIRKVFIDIQKYVYGEAG